jgi:hypothetical protein
MLKINKIQESMEKNKIQTHCNNCLCETNHLVLYQYIYPKVVEFFSKQDKGLIKDKFYSIFICNYLFIECLGCESPSILVQEYHPKSTDKRYIKNLSTKLRKSSKIEIKPISEITFPPTIQRNIPKWIKELPLELMDLFLEIYSAIHQGLFRLSTMGSRTILDIIMTEKIGDKGTFKNKLNSFLDSGYINKVQFELLEIVLEAGNAASHRGYKPKEKDFEVVLDIIENLVEQDILLSKGISIKNSIPPRESK